MKIKKNSSHSEHGPDDLAVGKDLLDEAADGIYRDRKPDADAATFARGVGDRCIDSDEAALAVQQDAAAVSWIYCCVRLYNTAQR